MDKDILTYMGHLWVLVENDIVTVGIGDEGLEYADTISAVQLPEENEEVVAGDVCGEVETDDGPINLYSPVDGTVFEINPAVVDSPSLIREDPYGDGWLFKVEPKSMEALSTLSVDLQDSEDGPYETKEE